MDSREIIKAVLANLLPQTLYVSLNARVAAKDIGSGRRWVPEIAVLPRFIHPGDTVIDVGSNHGLYTYHLSRLVGPAGRVHAFEPVPLNLRILNRTIKVHRLGNVTVYGKACGDNPKRSTFYVPLCHGIPQLGGASQHRVGLPFECEVVRLDDVITSNIAFLKIDVEGAELLVLRGAQRILRESRPVILFEAANQTHRFGYEQQTVFDFLSGFGYRFLSGGFRGKALEPRQCFTEAEDYFCLPR